MSVIASIKNRVMEGSRRAKIEHFYSLVDPQFGTPRILDVGVSPELGQGGPHMNYFLQTFRYDDAAYTGLGVEDLSATRARYTGKQLVEYGGGRFPFDDSSFTHAFSNAVIEHVGDEQAQIDFVNEMARVARTVFFTTPNKFFPIESHTNAVLVHWSDERFRRWCAKHNPYWTSDNLYLFSYARLRGLLMNTRVRDWHIQVNRLAGWPMTFSVVCRGQR